jgi:anti-sigma28 factor (negative regulator of flagellin synthesis)
MKVMDLQEQVGRGEYHVNPEAVADAIVRRILGDRGPRSTQKSGPSA